MTKQEEMIFVFKHAEKILELVDNAENFTRSDVQGIADAIVLRILHELKKGSHL